MENISELTEVFFLHDAWRLILDGVMVPAEWNCKGAAEAAVPVERARRAKKAAKVALSCRYSSGDVLPQFLGASSGGGEAMSIPSVIRVYDALSYVGRKPALNMRQLLNPLVFSPTIRHPDMKRQASRRQRAKDLAAARRLKLEFQEYVPRNLVAPLGPPEELDIFTGNRQVRRYSGFLYV